MTGKGVVVKTDFKTATVRIRKSSACGHDCGECRVCTNPEFETEVINNIGAKVGDTVIIGAPAGAMLKMAFILYILPIIGTVICCAVSDIFSKSAAVKAMVSAVWLIIWFFYIKYFNRNKVNTSSILEVADEAN